MKPGYGSRKGSSFERKIAKELSLWWSDNKRNDLYWRTHSSVQLGTRSKKKNEYGDLMSIDDYGKEFTNKFHLELRHGICIKVQELVYPTKPSASNMSGFIKEGLTGAKESNRRPMWIFREQGRPTMVLMQYIDFCSYIPRPVSMINNVIIAMFPEQGLVLLTLDNFKIHFNKKLIGG